MIILTSLKKRHTLAKFAEEVGDITYYHQAVKQPNALEFVEAIVKKYMVTWMMKIGNRWT